jgi:hypothetical protein
MRFSRIDFRPALAVVLTGALTGVALAGPRAAEHVVPAEALTQSLEARSAARAADERTLQDVLGEDAARKTLEAAGLDAQQVTAGVAALDDEELAGLAERARAFQAEAAAGALNNQQITYILIALGTAVIVLIIVGAK